MEFNEKYLLQSPVTGKFYPDRNWMLEEPSNSQPHLLRAVYRDKQFRPGPDARGFYKYDCWLPVTRTLEGSGAPVTYKSQGLAGYLGLENLYITFSGYWPEQGARMKTCSFKETEAYAVCARLDPGMGKTLVVASAGNTARSFARVCSDNKIPLLLCVPYDTIDVLWFDSPLDPCVRLICTETGSDYFDAIHLSGLICNLEGYLPEGGARNVARRDGMGTTVLSAVNHIGRIPAYYFQAVGSGTGAIAAWEANLRFIADGRFGNNRMKLMLSQNLPFKPMVDAWNANSRELFPMTDQESRDAAGKIMAKVLSNRKPPYGLAGGLFDAMKDNGGNMYAVSNEEALEAGAVFLETEGVDIHPAAAVATASLIRAAEEGHIGTDDLIMLNITGGGEEKFKKERSLFHLRPFAVTPSSVVKEDLRGLI